MTSANPLLLRCTIRNVTRDKNLSPATDESTEDGLSVDLSRRNVDFHGSENQISQSSPASSQCNLKPKLHESKGINQRKQ
jgi:hypothetical protein